MASAGVGGGPVPVRWAARVLRYEFRQATPADMQLVRELKFSGLRPYVEELWGWDAEDQEKRFRASFVPDRQQIIRHDDEDVGMLHVEEQEDSVVLAGIYVAARHRSKGLGSAVIRDVLFLAARCGKPVRLRVLRPNPARQLYERLGFRVCGESETHFTMEAPVGAGPAAERPVRWRRRQWRPASRSANVRVYHE